MVGPICRTYRNASSWGKFKNVADLKLVVSYRTLTSRIRVKSDVPAGGKVVKGKGIVQPFESLMAEDKSIREIPKNRDARMITGCDIRLCTSRHQHHTVITRCLSSLCITPNYNRKVLGRNISLNNRVDGSLLQERFIN